MSTLLGLALSNVGVIPASAPTVYGTVNKFLLPLAVPMLLLAADLRKVITHTGQLLVAFILGALGTTLGTLVAFRFIPLTSLGNDGWKVSCCSSQGTLVAIRFIPPTPLGNDGWKVSCCSSQGTLVAFRYIPLTPLDNDG